MEAGSAGINKLRPAIARILDASDEIVGAGLLVSDREVITCAHVVGSALGLRVGSAAPRVEVRLDFPMVRPVCTLTASVNCWDPEGDVAGLKLDEDPPAKAQPMCLSVIEDLWQHDFGACGFPFGQSEGAYAHGILLARNARNHVQMACSKKGFIVQEGFSGAPVWDVGKGCVVGIVVEVANPPDECIAWMIPASRPRQACRELEQYVAVAPVETKSVRIKIEGPFDPSGAQEVLKYMAALLAMNPDVIQRGVVIDPGCTKVAVGIPTSAATRLHRLAPERIQKLRSLGVTSITVEGMGIIDLTTGMPSLGHFPSGGRVQRTVGVSG